MGRMQYPQPTGLQSGSQDLDASVSRPVFRVSDLVTAGSAMLVAGVVTYAHFGNLFPVHRGTALR